ncbi:cytochrome c oxidase subunit I [bacterium]|nr:cytochrome c oxidase subunit I [bacterium]|tara:strand:+ start:2747 stop:4618 length:1872 start_codon:yes stop_codon:yes gene_type:complete
MSGHGPKLALPKFLSFLRNRPTKENGLVSWLTTVDHKRIGILYLYTSFFFLFVGGIEALFVRTQLSANDLEIFVGSTYNQLVTMHATTMIFLAIMPLAAAFFNFMIPLQIGARDVAFPRLNAFSYFMYLAGGIVLNASWFMGGASDVGWFAYAPLTSSTYSPTHGVDFWILGLILTGISSTVAAINFIVTIINMRAPGMTLMKMPVFSWMAFVTAFLLAFALPVITIALIILFMDRNYGTTFFQTAAGGDPILWQHLFWVFGHPEVYIIVLPAFGIVSEIIPVFSKKPLFGYKLVVLSGAAIGFMGFTVWSHHMFTVGMGPIVNSAFSITTAAIAIPTGVKIFNWILTLWNGKIKFSVPMMYATALVFLFMVGGFSGLMHGAAASDFQQHDTYFVVAHFHYTILGGGLFGFLAGTVYWLPKFFGKIMDEERGRKIFWWIFASFNLTFFPMHFLGTGGMPRRIYTYSADMEWTALNGFITLASFVLGITLLVFFIEVIKAVKSKNKASADPWDARTLEWSIPSPPPVYNFADLPKVEKVDEFWESKISNKPIKTLPRDPHGIHMPGKSWMPLITSVGLMLASFGAIYQSDLRYIGLGIFLLAYYGWALEGDAEYYLPYPKKGKK